MSILLEAEHLTKIFTQRGKNPFKAVNDVSFTLKKGETLGIVGESGSGKSTIAKLLTRLTDITEGTLKFEGKDITRLKQSQLKEVYGDIQMVFQNPVGSFDPRRTLGDGIGESLRNRGMKKADVEKRVAELLKQCGLEKEYATSRAAACYQDFFLSRCRLYFIPFHLTSDQRIDGTSSCGSCCSFCHAGKAS